MLFIMPRSEKPEKLLGAEIKDTSMRNVQSTCESIWLSIGLTTVFCSSGVKIQPATTEKQ
jgi:hypothetical protein